VAEALTPLSTKLKSLLDSFGPFIKMVDTIAEVHPYATAAWKLLRVAYTLASEQQSRDNNIIGLVDTMQDMYESLLRKDKLWFGSQKIILETIARQTQECGYFIRDYLKSGGFAKKAISNSITSVDKTIKQY